MTLYDCSAGNLTWSPERRMYKEQGNGTGERNMAQDIIQIGIYDASRLRGIIEAAPKVAWRAAVTAVKAYSHADGVTGLRDGWYRTANRVGYARGIFHCTPMRADVSK